MERGDAAEGASGRQIERAPAGTLTQCAGAAGSGDHALDVLLVGGFHLGHEGAGVPVRVGTRAPGLVDALVSCKALRSSPTMEVVTPVSGSTLGLTFIPSLVLLTCRLIS